MVQRSAWLSPELLTQGLTIVGILLLGLLASRVLASLVKRYRRAVLQQTLPQATEATTKRLQTLSMVMSSAGQALIWLLVLFSILAQLGVNLAPLLAGAGIAGIAIGFGAQSLVKDLFYGFCILLENQFGLGDVIQVADAAGVVERMTLRAVSLRDLDGRIHIIPNGEVQKVIVFTRDWARMNVDVDLPPDVDLEHVFETIHTLNIRFFQENPTVLLEAPELLGVDSVGQHGLTLRIVGKTLVHEQWKAARLYRKSLKQAFDAAHINLAPSVLSSLRNIAP